MEQIVDYIQFACGFSDSPKLFGALLTVLVAWVIPLGIAATLRAMGKPKAAEAFEHLSANVGRFALQLIKLMSPAGRATAIIFVSCLGIGALQACRSYVPDPQTCVTTDGRKWYCAEWTSDVPIAGELSGMVCARTEAELRLKEQQILQAAPKATLREVSR